MTLLSGLTFKDKDNLNGDISIEFIGLIPGEKMYEELLLNYKSEPKIHPKIIRGTEKFDEYYLLLKEIKILKDYLFENNAVNMLKQLEKNS